MKLAQIPQRVADSPMSGAICHWCRQTVPPDHPERALAWINQAGIDSHLACLKEAMGGVFPR
jgi:hypothetical protein